jgi:Metal binding domain of Ada
MGFPSDTPPRGGIDVHSADGNSKKKYRLIGSDGQPYLSEVPGTLGGYSKLRIYGRLDCWSAKRHIANGHYVPYRVFFADEPTAIAAGYRPCGKCLPEKYRRWKVRSAQP